MSLHFFAIPALKAQSEEDGLNAWMGAHLPKAAQPAALLARR